MGQLFSKTKTMKLRSRNQTPPVAVGIAILNAEESRRMSPRNRGSPQSRSRGNLDIVDVPVEIASSSETRSVKKKVNKTSSRNTTPNTMPTEMRLRPNSSTPLNSQINQDQLRSSQSPVRATLNSSLRSSTEASPERAFTHSFPSSSLPFYVPPASESNLSRISESPSLSLSPSPTRRETVLESSAETLSSRRRFSKRVRSTRLNSSSSSSGSSSPKRSRRVQSFASTSPENSRRDVSRTNTRSSTKKTVPKGLLESESVSHHAKMNPSGHDKDIDTGPRRAGEQIRNSSNNLIPKKRRKLVRDFEEAEGFGNGILESAALPHTWVLLSVFSIELGNKLDQAAESQTMGRVELTNLLKNYIERVWDFPDEIIRQDLHFFAVSSLLSLGRVIDSCNEEPFCSSVKLSGIGAPSNGDVWKLSLKGIIAPCIEFSARAGNILLIYGCEIDPIRRRISIDSKNMQNSCYIFNYYKNVCDSAENQGKNKPDYKSKHITSYNIYSSKYTASTYLRFDSLSSCSVVLTWPFPTSGETETSGYSVRSPSRKTGEIHIRYQNPGPSNFETVVRTSQDRGQDNDTRTNIHAEVIFTRDMERRSNSLSSIESNGLRITEPEIENMDYDDWVESGRCVPGDQRPKVKKVRTQHGYEYKTLKQLDDELRRQIISEYRSKSKLTMVLPEHQFTYGVIVEIAPPQIQFIDSYVALISDDSMDKVMLRICTTEMDRRVGPKMEIGQVIRVHRMTVQVENDKLLGKHAMVLSTAPHQNYTLFYYKENSLDISFNTLAKSPTVKEDDKPRVSSLLNMWRERNHWLSTTSTSVNYDDVSISETSVPFLSDEEYERISSDEEIQTLLSNQEGQRVVSNEENQPSPSVSYISECDDDVPSEEEIPLLHQEETPPSHQQEIPIPHQDEVPPSLQDEIPLSHQDEIPSTSRGNIETPKVLPKVASPRRRSPKFHRRPPPHPI